MLLANQTTQELRTAVVHLIKELPVLPVCRARLMRENVGEDEHIDDILNLAIIEPCLSIRIFQMAVKVMPSRKISGIRHAMMLVGSRAIDELIRSHLDGRAFNPQTDEERLLWAHFLFVSIAAEKLAVRYADLGVNPQQAREGGLLHDLGRLVQYENRALPCDALAERPDKGSDETINAQEVVFGTSHARLGSIAADVIKAPDYVRVCIDYHHSRPVSIPRKVVESHGPLIETVTTADEMAMFCHRWSVNDNAEFKYRAERFLKHQSLFLKHLRPDLDDLHQLVVQSFNETEQSFRQLDLGPMPEFSKIAHQMLYS